MNDIVMADNIIRLEEISLDKLWQEAETLGSIEVSSASWRERSYKVEITFFRASGSMIKAVGKNTSIHFAVADAINEARELGAGE